MITQFKKTCPVCGEEFIFTNVRDVPTTCYKRMCQVNYKAYKNRSTLQGVKPDLKEMGIWSPSRDYKRFDERSKAKK